MALRYRADIDGLRTLAVVPIVLYHFGASSISGGFVGVDIFFVISGYLITSILLRESTDRGFSVLEFYHRRAVRIFPALFALIVTLFLLSPLLLPSQIDELGLSAAFTVTFSSNLFFWYTADYFAPSSETMLLLHTWSLGVEEQFYIFYPFLLYAMRRFWPRHVALALTALIAASFALSLWLGWTRPEAAFYLLPSRAWELGLGGLVAVLATGPANSVGDRLRQPAAWLGLGLIALGYGLIRSDGGGFPAPWALLPCAGTALLIWKAEGTFVGKALAAAPMTFVGRISYSLYLWHWPLIVLYRIFTNRSSPNLTEGALLFAGCLALAWLSYRFIEQPAQRRWRGVSPARTVSAGIAAIAVLAVLGLAIGFWRDAVSRAPAEARRLAAFDDYADSAERQMQFRRGVCFRTGEDKAKAMNPALCMTPDAAKPNMVLIGDSHAAQYWRALALRHPDWHVMQANASGCRPLVGTTGTARCLDVVNYALGPLLHTGKVRLVVVAGRWLDEDLPLLPATIAHIRKAGADVVVIGPTVEYAASAPDILARTVWNGLPVSAAPSHLLPERKDLDARMRRLVEAEGVAYVDVQDIICPAGECRALTPGGVPMQFDYGHLTFPASRWVVDRMPAFPIAAAAPVSPKAH